MIEIFGKDGPLARAIDGYRPREGQIAMANAVAVNRGLQVLEAGTGIGKTFAYLAPIIGGGLSAVISTGTRALQDQLFLRDIPFLSQALNRPVRAAMLKGRSNYVCRRNLAQPSQSQLFSGNDDWARVLAFADTDEDGDIRGASGIPADSPVWPAAVSTRETCPAHGCDFYDKCFLYRARTRAQQADIVVVNHSLFLSDMRLREEAIVELLPARDMVVFDEAHLLPSLAPQYFGESLSVSDMLRVLAEIDRRGSRTQLPPAFAALAKQWRATIGALLESSESFSDSAPARDVLAMTEWKAALLQLTDAIGVIRDAAIDNATKAEAEEGEWFANTAARIAATHKRLDNWRTLAEDKDTEEKPEDDEEQESEDIIPSVCWVQKNEKQGGMTLHAAPVSGRNVFRRSWGNCKNVVMTSATLSVNGALDRFVEDAGMDGAHAESWASPFDFAERTLLYLPPDMPAPNDRGYTEAVVNATLPLVRANGGRAFVLFSSWRALRQGAALLEELLEGQYEIIKQGEAPNDELLRRFRKAKNAILIGSLSFWQGVDVKGDALSLVVVDKIPFAPPDSPLLAARDEWRKKRGEDPFMCNQIPPAAILMKQVAGRLMRDFGDWGVFTVCDPRLLRRSYGKLILNSLPPMRRVEDEKTACDFLRDMRDTVSNTGL